MKRIFIISALVFLSWTGSFAQSKSDMDSIIDSLVVKVKERTTVDSPFKLDKMLHRGSEYDFYFSKELKDYPWTEANVKWFRNELKSAFEEINGEFTPGRIYTGGQQIQELLTPELGNDGKPSEYQHRYNDPAGKTTPLVERVGVSGMQKGLKGRVLSIWPSHGKYYEEDEERWEWQRASTHRTVEDIFTQSFVLTYLIPMLENAGAYILTPRERDTQTREIITDNDPSFERGDGKVDPKSGLPVRTEGKYSESGKWESAGAGFADLKENYLLGDNPFSMGTARKAKVISREKDVLCEARWTPDVKERGEYAVYISYKSLPNSSESAHYTVYHARGKSEFIVNQKVGGGTWIYLGTFEFLEGTDGAVVLDNMTPEGRKFNRESVVTADAVKLGGGIGKIARGPEAETSGIPSYEEGALYWMTWAGVDMSIMKDEWDDDYSKDFAGRGAWTSWMAGGSVSNPGEKGEGIPIDLSLGFHSDAGVTPSDSTVGTLAIYTRLCDGKTTLPDGKSRMTCRALAASVQDQVCNDIRAGFDSLWSRRMLWDQNYSESRTSGVPAMILELLSHQNLADMKYGLDPEFRFTVSRAVYKGILKFFSNLYGCNYAVQPLPVTDFSAMLEGRTAKLDWTGTKDELEPTAVPKGYVVFTRMDDRPFDQGQRFEGTHADIPITPGHLYSFKVVAFNDGGYSFPSETLSVGVPSEIDRRSFSSERDLCLIVNNFTRLSSPTWIDGPEYAGFNGKEDSGVDYMGGINFLGENYEFRRSAEWTDDDNPGWGASEDEYSSKKIPGNNFDFVSVHARALMDAGYAVASISRSAFCKGAARDKAFAIDLLCGKQVTTKTGAGNVPDRFEVFPLEMQDELRRQTGKGTNLIVSGTYIGTDAWDSVYPVAVDSLKREMTQDFIKSTLGYQWRTNHGSKKGDLYVTRDFREMMPQTDFHFLTGYNDKIYPIEYADGIIPAALGKDAVKFGMSNGTFLKYKGSDISAAVLFDAVNYKVVSFGFPLEAIDSQEDLAAILKAVLSF